MFLRKLFGGFTKLFPVARKFFGEICPQRMVGLGIVDKGDEALDHLVRLRRRFPVLRRNNRQTNLALLVDVWVIDLCFERNFRRFEWVLGREIDLNSESPFVIRCVVGNDKALPAQNVRVIHVDVTEGRQLRSTNVLQLLRQTPCGRHVRVQMGTVGESLGIGAVEGVRLRDNTIQFF